ncbi:restriction endonuclease subunit S [Deinococcus arcticus]|uniref:Type I restriction modification DNA specificity domain-containing protein n=1 Tax=Deinococcus arcticus TaxID=2136176 RepID=A0A2T3W9N8_9DEIO|nr:restriction endonuclease subunit S [Deinococcus arcticus]PTA68605.1 hypothetical protein C8263_07385 [Deinococcus arcticus]
MSWDQVRLGDLTHFIRGVTFKPDAKVEVGSEGSVVCFRTSNVQTKLDQSDLIAVPRDIVKRDEQFVRHGDLLVSSANSWNLVGKACWVPELSYEATLGGFISALRINSPRLDPRYLFHWFTSSKVQDTVRSFGRQTTNISNLDFARALNLEIPLPPLHIQQRIAAVLDEVDALRQKRERSIEKLRLLKSEAFKFAISTVEVREITLGEMCYITKGTTPTTLGFDFSSAGAKFLRVQNLVDGRIVHASDDLFINRETNSALARSIILPNDVLLSIAGTIGRSALVIESDGEMNCNQAIAIIRPLHSINSAYLREWLDTSEAQAQMRGSSVTATIANLSLGSISKMRFPMPDLAHQVKILIELQVIQDQIDYQRASLNHMRDLGDTLQSQAFSGSLTLRNFEVAL